MDVRQHIYKTVLILLMVVSCFPLAFDKGDGAFKMLGFAGLVVFGTRYLEMLVQYIVIEIRRSRKPE